MDTLARLILFALVTLALSSDCFAYGQVPKEEQTNVQCTGAGGRSGAGASFTQACRPIIESIRASYTDPFYGTDKSWMPGSPTCTLGNAGSGGCSGNFKCGGGGICFASASGTMTITMVCPSGSTGDEAGKCFCSADKKPNTSTTTRVSAIPATPRTAVSRATGCGSSRLPKRPMSRRCTTTTSGIPTSSSSWCR